MSIELTAPLTLIWTKFQPVKCHVDHVHCHRSIIYPKPSETAIYRSDISGHTRKVPEPSADTSIFRKLTVRAGRMICFSENGYFA